MKIYHHLLSLNGYGYLQDIVEIGAKKIAKIKALTHFNPSHCDQDDVWINCEINDAKQLEWLSNLLHSVHLGASVLVTFNAEYAAFVDAYSGQMPGDPKHMVTLQTKLRSLGECYINGCLAGKNESLLNAVA